MGKSTPSAPAAPDPVATANAQANANLVTANQTANLNRVNQVSPYGTSVYVRPGQPIPAIPSYSTAPAGGNPSVTGVPWINPPAAPGAAPGASSPNPARAIAQREVERLQALASNTWTNDNGEEQGNPDAQRQLMEARQRLADIPTTLTTSSSSPQYFVKDGQVVDALGNPAHNGAVETHGRPNAGVDLGQWTGQSLDMTQGSDGSWSAPGSTVGNSTDPWTQISYLDPAEQANLDKQRSLTSALLGLGQGQIGKISDTLSTPMNWNALPAVRPQGQAFDPRTSSALTQGLDTSGAPAMPTPFTPLTRDAFSADQQRVTDQLYGLATQRLDPRFTQERASVESMLADQGITIQSNPEAYRRAIDQFGQTKNDAYQQALSAALTSGIGLQGQLANESLAQQNQSFTQGASTHDAAINEALQKMQMGMAQESQMFGQTQQIDQTNMARDMALRQQAITEALAQRNQPINELSALMGQAPGVSTPQFQNVPGVGVANTDTITPTMNAYQGALNSYNQRMAQNNATTGAVAGLAGAGLTAAFPAAKIAAPALAASGITSARF